MQRREKALVLFSGGLDSTTCLARAVERYGRENVVALSLSYGQKHQKEIEAAKRVAEYYNVELISYDLSEIFKHAKCSLLEHDDEAIPEQSYEDQLKATGGKPVSTYVPFRNGLFLSVAATVAMSKCCNVIYYGIHRDDATGNAYPDCSELFNYYISGAIFAGTGYEVSVEAPYVDKNKADIVKDGLKMGVPYELTWSCYEGKDKPCGKCGTCRDRIKAFESNGVHDPLKYK